MRTFTIHTFIVILIDINIKLNTRTVNNAISANNIL